MPKRNRIVHLTKTSKKGHAHKERLIEDVRTACDTYAHAFVFTVPNARNQTFSELRGEWADSRFFLGKNKVMAVALGQTLESEHCPGAFKLASMLKGQCGLLFTNRSAEDVLEFFSNVEEPNFARSGFVATHDFALNKGILEDQPFSIEPTLRKLGLISRLNNGQVELECDTQVCRKGDKLTPNQCVILERFNVMMAVMRVLIHGHFDIKAGKIQKFEHEEVEVDDDDEEEDQE